jgi:hypothetical protein
MDAEKRKIMQERLDRIRSACADGLTVHYCVGMRTFRFTSKNVDSLAVRGDSLCVRSGKNWLNIDYYCSIKAG